MQINKQFLVRSAMVSLIMLTAVANIFIGDTRKANAAVGLTAGYAFTEGSGTTTADISGNNISGTLTNGPTWSPGHTGTAVTFDGVNDYVNLGTSALLPMSGSFTVSAWVYETADPADDGIILGKNNGAMTLKSSPDTGSRTFAITIQNTSNVNIQRYSNTVRNLNTWYHVTGVYDAATPALNIYVNGVLDNGQLSGTIPTTRSATSSAFEVGRRGAGFYLIGKVDDLRIYNRVLSLSEIQSDMSTALDGGVPPVVDTTPPTVSISSPTNGASVSASTSITANASDDTGLAGVQFKLDGSNIGSEDTSAPYSFTWDTTTTSNASHTITATARDTANNTTTSAGITVTVSNGANPPPTPPPPPGPTPPPGAIMPSDRDASANWKMAGLLSQGGIPNRTTVCATINASTYGNGTTEASGGINTAISACPAGQVVQLSAGTFRINEGNTINLNKGVTLRGAGAGVTILNRTNGATWNSFQPGSNPGPLVRLGGANQGTAINFAADGAEESYSVQLASTAGLSVGQIVLIDEASGAQWMPERIGAWAAAGYSQIWASSDYRVVWPKHNPGFTFVDDLDPGQFPYQANSPGCWFSRCDRPTNEMHQISSISGNTVTFDSPLMISYRVSHQAQLVPYSNMVQKAGLENVTVQGGDSGNVNINQCAYCWSQNVENTFWLGHGFNIVESFRSQLEGVYAHNAAWPVNGGGGYAISFEWGSSEALIQNSISMLANKAMVANSSGSGSVIAYNYMDDAYINGTDSDTWTEVGLNASHMVGPHHVLFEGNYSFNFDSDMTHGNSIYLTVFRNYLSGFRRTFTALDGRVINDSAGCCGPMRVAATHAYAYWFSFIGNVLGTPGQMNNWTYDCVNPTNDIAGPCIWNLGWMDISPQGNDPFVAPTTIRDGNYDYKNNQQKWITTPAGFTIPDSLYLTAKPAFFCSSSWPWVNPTSGTLGTLPAKVRLEAGTPNTIATCGAPSFDFSMSNGGNKTVAAGSSTTNTITSTLSAGSTTAVSFSASGLPTGASASFSPTTCSPTCTTTMTITTTSSTPAGSPTITVSATGGSVTRTTTFTLTVTTGASVTPTPIAFMPVISRSKPAFASVNNSTAGQANDANYGTEWSSGTTQPAWIAYDLSTVPANQRQQVVVAWHTGTGNRYDNAIFPEGKFDIPGPYVIETNTAASAASAPTTGWTTGLQSEPTFSQHGRG
ncbi:MAG: hypothetical protein KW804_00370 [Candidatus Doudnabacteria bacterium]|nr:hypothetical protein [Candidatus Doudnabacteria bacterium]